MMRTRTALLGALLGVLVLGVSGAARAEVLGAELQVSGMSCPFCAFGIEKKLRPVGVPLLEGALRPGSVSLGSFTSFTGIVFRSPRFQYRWFP